MNYLLMVPMIGRSVKQRLRIGNKLYQKATQFLLSIPQIAFQNAPEELLEELEKIEDKIDGHEKASCSNPGLNKMSNIRGRREINSYLYDFLFSKILKQECPRTLNVQRTFRDHLALKKHSKKFC